jgi:hypothetical protein
MARRTLCLLKEALGRSSIAPGAQEKVNLEGLRFPIESNG